MDYDRVLPEVFVGSYPADLEDIDRLVRDAGVTAVLNLQTDEDADYLNVDGACLEAHYQRRGVAFRQIPVTDFDTEDLCANLPDCVRALGELLAAGHTVYVHCTSGVGRSPSVVVSYLYWMQQWDLDRALDHVTKHRPCSPNMEAIHLATFTEDP